MDSRKLVEKWHKKIIAEREQRLNRKLTADERKFITARGGFIALELIDDTVKSIRGKELEIYLNSEN